MFCFPPITLSIVASLILCTGGSQFETSVVLPIMLVRTKTDLSLSVVLTENIPKSMKFGLSERRVTREVHPTACVDVVTFVDDCFTTDNLTSSGVGSLCLAGNP